jgi:hypothetical protein
MLVKPLILFENLTTFRSNHPHLLGLPVVAPNSKPTFYKRVPISSKHSVGNGPPPTLVVYAFIIPMAVSIFEGGTPKPVQTPPAVVVEDVIYGYVPKSISSIVALAPSAIILFFGSLRA